MVFLPELSVFLAFCAAVVVLTVTPGPDMVFFLGKAISQSRSAGLIAMSGAAVGTLVHTIFVAIGVSALLAASTLAFTILKIVGAIYLFWLAVQSVRGGSTFAVKETREAPQSLKKVFMQALGINLLNPKIVVFFVTFMPQFVAADDPHAFGKLLFLGFMFSVIAVPMVIPMIVYAEKIAVKLKKSTKVARGIDYLFATVLGGFALKLLFTQAK